MNEKEFMKIKDLVDQLNSLANQRKDLLDKLWILENETEKRRLELVALLAKSKGEDI